MIQACPVTLDISDAILAYRGSGRSKRKEEYLYPEKTIDCHIAEERAEDK